GQRLKMRDLSLHLDRLAEGEREEKHAAAEAREKQARDDGGPPGSPPRQVASGGGQQQQPEDRARVAVAAGARLLVAELNPHDAGYGVERDKPGGDAQTKRVNFPGPPPAHGHRQAGESQDRQSGEAGDSDPPP